MSRQARAQANLRQIARGLDMRVLSRPEVYVDNVWEKIKVGELADPVVRDLIAQSTAATATAAKVQLKK